MRYRTQCSQSQQMQFLRNQFAQAEGLPFSEVLSAELVMQALQAVGVDADERIYTPPILLWVFLSQVLSADGSCREAVARLLAYRAARGEKSCSARTGAYCQARARMPEEVFATCLRQTGQRMEEQAPAGWRWKGRDVKIADGTTCSMPDTAENQAAYPQPKTQKPGVGFPLLRLLAVFSLATGALLDLRFCRHAGKYQSELGLLRTLWDLFFPGDIVMTDRYLCSWFEIAMLRRKGIDVVMRLHQARHADFRRGEKLGRNDHVVKWVKPAQCPDWMDAATYASLPEELSMREIRVQVSQPGFRTEEVIVVTTLLDSELYTQDEVAQLYRARWNAELDLRSLKDTMHMDVLRGQSPDIVHKEIWVHGLAYNLIRTIMAQAAWQYDLLPRTISFKGALQTLHEFQPYLTTTTPRNLPQLYEKLLHAIATHRVGNRPDRYEPRVKKRRPKPYPLMTRPRSELRIALCHNS
jgi:hypothetical protein